MNELTMQELEIVRAQMDLEETLVNKCRQYADMVGDPQLKIKCQQVAAQHANHYDTLKEHLPQEEQNGK